MKIEKYKKRSNGRYNLYLDDGRELLLYEETILEYGLLLHKEILDSQLVEICEFDLKYAIYYTALSSIKRRAKSVFDLKQSLLEKEFDESLVDEVIDILKRQGYLNDTLFARSYINSKINSTLYGPYVIRSYLENMHIASVVIDEELAVFDIELQKERIAKIIEHDLKINKTRGGNILRKKIVDNLKVHGYDYSLISNVISNYDFPINLDVAKKEREKLYKKYSKKYSGQELEYKIQEKLFAKGLGYEKE